MAYEGELISIGAQKSTTDHIASHINNRNLCRENRKKANPTMPYSFTNVPKTMKKAAQPSFSFSIRKKEESIIAATAILNCCIKRAVGSVIPQNQSINIFCFSRSPERTIAKYSHAVRNSNHSNIPAQSGNRAKGAMTRENTGP